MQRSTFIHTTLYKTANSIPVTKYVFAVFAVFFLIVSPPPLHHAERPPIHIRLYHLTTASIMSSQPPRVAWTGLGNMGVGMVKNIVQKGTYTGPLQLHNRTISKAESLVSTLESGKAQVASSITTCVDNADIVFMCVADDASVEATIAEAIKSTSIKDTLIVDCSTIHPDTTNRVQQKVEATGAHFVACPVFGAPPMAESGSLITVLAGPKAQVDRVLPFCKDVMARAEVNFSDQPCGAATRLKSSATPSSCR